MRAHGLEIPNRTGVIIALADSASNLMLTWGRDLNTWSHLELGNWVLRERRVSSYHGYYTTGSVVIYNRTIDLKLAI